MIQSSSKQFLLLVYVREGDCLCGWKLTLHYTFIYLHLYTVNWENLIVKNVVT